MKSKNTMTRGLVWSSWTQLFSYTHQTHPTTSRRFRELTLFLIPIMLVISLTASPTVFQVESKTQKSASQSDSLQGVQATTEEVSGVRRVIFTTKRGNKVYVNLPDDIASGDTVSGTVFAEGAGKTDTERANSLQELKDQTIDIAGHKVPATGGTFELDATRLTMNGGDPCWVIWGSFAKYWRCTFPPQPQDDIGFYVAPNGESGKLIEIRGSFDGKFGANDYVKVANQEMLLLVQTPRKTVFLNASPVVGPTEIEIKEKGQLIKRPFRNLKLTMSAQKYDLRKGERTQLKVMVEGLSDLQQTIPLELTNRSPNIMSMEGGNVQKGTIRPEDVKQGGVYETQRTLTGIQVGAFLIQGSVSRDETSPGAADGPHHQGSPGELHNKGVEFVLSRLKEIPKAENRRQVVIELTKQYFQSINEPVSATFTVPDIPKDSKSFVNKIQGSNALKKSLNSLLKLPKQHTNLRKFNEALDKLARKTAPTLKGEELERFSDAASVARSSAAFWAPPSQGGMNGIRFLGVRDSKPQNFLDWVYGDVSGCIACWPIYPPVGCAACGIVWSVYEALQ